MTPLTRRAALAAAPVLLLASCGSTTPADQPADPNVDLGTQKEGDIALLNQLREAEAAATAEGGSKLVRAIARQSADRLSALEQAIGTLGGTAAAATPSGEPGDAAVLAAQQGLLATYVDVIPKLADGRLRELCAGFFADSAGRVAELRMAAGENAAPKAFV